MLNTLFKKKYTTETFKKLLDSSPDIDELEKALKSGIDINFVNDDSETFLHSCIKRGLTKSGRFLIQNNIDINIEDKNENKPIDLAIEKNNRLIASALLDTGNVKINELKETRTLLQEAVFQGDKEIIVMLLKKNINVNNIDNKNRNVMYDAIANGNQKVIDTILGIEDLDLNLIDINGQTILHQKNVIEDDKLAIKLIKKGADPTILDKDGKNYLLYAALRGMETEEIIDAAIEAGFNLNRPVRNKNSILMEIMFSFTKLSNTETHRREDLMHMASKLVKKGIDINLINEQKETVLFDAVRKLDVEACKFLIKEKVPLDAVNIDGDTVLWLLIYKGIVGLDIILLILNNGANINIKNKDNQTIIEVLSDLILYTHGNIEINKDLEEKVNENGQYIVLLKEILLNSSFNANHLSSKNEPIFFKSLLNGNRALFDLFYKYGIDLEATNKEGSTIFLSYVTKIGNLPEIPKDFRKNLIMLIDKKVNINKQDKNGKTILSKLISCNNMQMFRILFSVTKFNYKLQDNKGFTIIHDCISTSNIDVIKLTNQLDDKLINISDNLGILPIAYAALFGRIKIVLALINLKSNFKSNKKIPNNAKIKLNPLLANVDKLTCEDKNDLYKLEILKDQIKRDFKIES